MRQLIGISLLILLAPACRQLETITTKTVTTIDSVQVSVPLAGHSFTESFTWADTLLFEDERLRIRIVPADSPLLPPDAAAWDTSVPLPPGQDARANGADSGAYAAPRFQILAEVKPDTAQVMVAEKTTTTQTTHVKYRRQMPWWGWSLIGAVLVGGFILGRKFRLL